MGLVNDINAILVENEIGTSGVDIFENDMPESPDACICIYNTGGFPRDLVGGKVEEPTFQIAARNAVHDTAETKINAIKDVLNSMNNQVVNSHTMLLIHQMSDIIPMGRDEHKRWKFVVNFRCYYKR